VKTKLHLSRALSIPFRVIPFRVIPLLAIPLLAIRLLVIYLICALLFLSSIELHIHTQEVATFTDHGAAVSITSTLKDFSSQLAVQESTSEIEVSPDGMLHAHQSTPNMLAIFLLLVLIVSTFIAVFIPQKRKSTNLKALPFYGSPALRGPPQIS